MADTSACVSCGRHPAYSFRVLEVQTLPLREMDGERKIQALGAIRRAAVCEDCARRRLEGTMDIAGTAGKGLLLYAGIMLAGIVSAVLFLRRFPPAGLTGCAAVICGIMYGAMKPVSKKTMANRYIDMHEVRLSVNQDRFIRESETRSPGRGIQVRPGAMGGPQIHTINVGGPGTGTFVSGSAADIHLKEPTRPAGTAAHGGTAGGAGRTGQPGRTGQSGRTGTGSGTPLQRK